MNRAILILVAGIFPLLVLSATAHAMPSLEEARKAAAEESDFFKHVLDTRRSAGDRYQAMREERLEAINRAAAREVGPSEQVPGWKLSEAPLGPPAEEEEGSGGLYILLLVGAGVFLSLVLRVVAPFLYHRGPKHGRSGEPMTIKLKPREERQLRRI